MSAKTYRRMRKSVVFACCIDLYNRTLMRNACEDIPRKLTESALSRSVWYCLDGKVGTAGVTLFYAVALSITPWTLLHLSGTDRLPSSVAVILYCLATTCLIAMYAYHLHQRIRSEFCWRLSLVRGRICPICLHCITQNDIQECSECGASIIEERHSCEMQCNECRIVTCLRDLPSRRDAVKVFDFASAQIRRSRIVATSWSIAIVVPVSVKYCLDGIGLTEHYNELSFVISITTGVAVGFYLYLRYRRQLRDAIIRIRRELSV